MASRRRLAAFLLFLWFVSPLWVPSNRNLEPPEEKVVDVAVAEVYSQLDALRWITPKVVAEDVFRAPEFKHHLLEEGQVAWEVHLVGYTWFHIPWNRMRVMLVEDERHSSGYSSLAGSIRPYWSAEWKS
jgi:hypothetical protein